MSQEPLYPFPKSFAYSKERLNFEFHKLREVVDFPNLYLREELPLYVAKHEQFRVAVLGEAYFVDRETDGDEPLKLACTALLRALTVSRTSFYEELAALAGRFVVAVQIADRVQFFNDALGTRPIFYSKDFSVVASHARLIEELLKPPIYEGNIPFLFGYPGNGTPYLRVNILTPNTFLDVSVGEVQRFWPLEPMNEIPTDEAAGSVSVAIRNFLKNISKHRGIRLGLTAGFDSRIMFSELLRSEVPFSAYTYQAGPGTMTDVRVARSICEEFAVKHDTVPQASEISDEDLRSLRRTSYCTSAPKTIRPLQGYFSDPKDVSLSGVLFEAGYNFYDLRDENLPSFADPKVMASFYYKYQGQATRRRIANFGKSRHCAFSEQSFQNWSHLTDFGIACQYIPSPNLFYWEHRCATWFGQLTLERDYYAETLLPFNARSVLETMLRVNHVSILNNRVPQLILGNADPALLRIPINP